MVLGYVPSLIKSPHYLPLWILVKDMFRLGMLYICIGHDMHHGFLSHGNKHM